MTGWTGEAEPGHPYWWDDRAGRAPLDKTPPAETDILVVGAGYTGLAAAIAAHDGGARVAVVDAGDPGQGASTRNGGMFGAHPRLGWPALARSFGARTADALFAEAATALASVLDLIADEAIDCDLQNTGRIQLAWTAPQFTAQKALVADIRAKSEVSAEIVERPGLGREIATEKYHGGIVFADHCAIHPARFHDGLLTAALRRGIPIIGQCPVTGVEPAAPGMIARTACGPIRAGKVILATNGYTPDAFRWHQRRVFPLPSYLIATEELPANLIGHIAPGRRMMVETRARHSYFRISPDGRRILFGGRASMRDIPLRRAADRLRRTMCEIWPDLSDARLSHVWTGNTGYSFSHVPTVGNRGDLHYAMGYSGSGTVLAPYLGMKAAWRALGDARGETAYAATPLRGSWLHPFRRPYFLSAADLWYRHWVDRRETWQGRR